MNSDSLGGPIYFNFASKNLPKSRLGSVLGRLGDASRHLGDVLGHPGSVMERLGESWNRLGDDRIFPRKDRETPGAKSGAQDGRVLGRGLVSPPVPRPLGFGLYVDIYQN